MGHGIIGARSFVKGIVGQGKDWHGKTIELPQLTREEFPDFQPRPVSFDTGEEMRPLSIAGKVWSVMADEDGPVGVPFCPDTCDFLTPRKAWDYIQEVLAGTGFKVERLGLLWHGSFWFLSVRLEELAGLSRKGESFQLNFSGSLAHKCKVQAELSHIRAVCWNTISASRARGQVLFAVKQTKNFATRLEATKAEVEKAVGMAAVFNRAMQDAENKACDEKQAREVYAGFLTLQSPRGKEIFAETLTAKGAVRENAARNTVDELAGLYRNGLGNNGRTRADVLNGATQLWTRGSAGSEKDVDTSIESGLFGGWADRKADFWRVVTDDKAWEETREAGKEALAMN